MVELLSIVVVGRNQRTSLEALLRQLQTLECAKELMYIDLNSSDDSVHRATLYADRIYKTNDTRSHYLHNWAYAIGTNHAEYDWVLTLDASCRLSEEYLEFLDKGHFRNGGQDVLAYMGHVFARGFLWEPSRTMFWMRWSQMGSALYEGILWRKSAALAAGNWNSRLGVHGGYDLLFRVHALRGSCKHLGWGTVEVGEMPIEAKSWFFQGTSNLFWGPLLSGRWSLWFRSHPWWIAMAASTIFMIYRTDFWGLAVWLIVQLGMLVSYGSAVQMATYTRWILWTLLPLSRWKRVEYQRIPVAKERLRLRQS